MVTREKIIKAAVHVFAGEGFHGARMENIARYGHMNKAMIYYFYQGKEELYIETVKFIYKNILENIFIYELSPANNKVEYFSILNSGICKLITFFKSNTDYLNIIIDATVSRNSKVYEAVKYVNETDNEKKIERLINFLESGKSSGFLNNISIAILIVNIFGIIILNLFPDYINKNFKISEQNNDMLIISEYEHIIDILLNQIQEGFFNAEQNPAAIEYG